MVEVERFMKQERQSQREYVSSESHYFAGKRYRLKVTEQDQPPKVRLLNNTRIGLVVRPGTDRDKREAVLYEWYREHLRAQSPKRFFLQKFFGFLIMLGKAPNRIADFNRCS